MACKCKPKKSMSSYKPNKADFNSKAIIGDEGHYIMIKGSIHQMI